MILESKHTMMKYPNLRVQDGSMEAKYLLMIKQSTMTYGIIHAERDLEN